MSYPGASVQARDLGSGCRSFDEINRLFGGLAEVVRREGILALDSMVAQKDNDEFIDYGMRLAVDGTEPGLIQTILETWLRSLVREQEMKYRKVMEGIMSIQSGNNPKLVEADGVTIDEKQSLIQHCDVQNPDLRACCTPAVCEVQNQW